MENISRFLEEGYAPREAALKGASEIGYTVLTISISLIAVFIPILLMGGIVGRLFREFAVTLSTAILVSMVVSLTTTPMMCAYLLKRHPKEEEHNWLYRTSERGFDFVLKVYRVSLTWVLENPGITIVVLVPHHRAERIALRPRTQGLFPGAGHRHRFRRPAGAIRRLFYNHERVGPEDRQGHQGPIRLSPMSTLTRAATAGTNGGFVYIALKPLGRGPNERKVNAMQVIARAAAPSSTTCP